MGADTSTKTFLEYLIEGKSGRLLNALIGQPETGESAGRMMKIIDSASIPGRWKDWMDRAAFMYLVKAYMERIPELRDIPSKSILKRIDNIPASDYVPILSEAFVKKLEHYLSMSGMIESIRGYDPGRKSPETVIGDLARLESEWISNRARKHEIIYVKDMPKPKLVKDFGNGFAWYDLEQPYDPCEAESGGHCGNINRKFDGSTTIYSLRKVKRHENGMERHIVYATVPVNSNGFIIEFKGRFNNKLEPEFEPYARWLLEQDFIRGYLGNGYAPENDFTVMDISDQEAARKLLDRKPDLAPYKMRETGEFIERFGVMEVPAENIAEEIGEIIIDNLAAMVLRVNPDLHRLEFFFEFDSYLFDSLVSSLMREVTGTDIDFEYGEFPSYLLEDVISGIETIIMEPKNEDFRHEIERKLRDRGVDPDWEDNLVLKLHIASSILSTAATSILNGYITDKMFDSTRGVHFIEITGEQEAMAEAMLAERLSSGKFVELMEDPKRALGQIVELHDTMIGKLENLVPTIDDIRMAIDEGI